MANLTGSATCRGVACTIGVVAAAVMIAWFGGTRAQGETGQAFPLLFVTQVPIPEDFATIGSTFANHRATPATVGRGGDLWIRYPDGALRNLTALAGFGHDGFQGPEGIAVRDPSVHWDGQKAVFSMVVGGASAQYRHEAHYWQLYEVTGLGRNEVPVITWVAGQPVDTNNISPVYGTDDRIIFTSDRSRTGERHLYPQLDEYESTPTVSGLWSLDPGTGDLRVLDHSPSGAFTPIIDSAGRVVFTRWDHLQRDQQADADEAGGARYGTFDFADESADAARTTARVEVFPEPRPYRRDLLAGTGVRGHTFNHFFPWQINEDGTAGVTLNHVGRHELHAYFDRSFDAPALSEFIAPPGTQAVRAQNLFQVKEDPTRPGTFVATDAPEFATHASGRIVEFVAPAGESASAWRLLALTRAPAEPVGGRPSGHFRNPLPLSSGELVAVHAAEGGRDENIGTREHPRSKYAFRLTRLVRGEDGRWRAGAPLTPGLGKAVSYWDPDVLVRYDGELWELDPVEVRPRPRPDRRVAAVAEPERAAIEAAGLSVEALEAWLRRQDLAVIVTRDVTSRDAADRQQPFNLRVAGSGHARTGNEGRLYDVSHLQIFQAEQVRGIGGIETPRAGRRVLARPVRDVPNPLGLDVAPGSVVVADDGSVAAFVPAGRALTWQLVDPRGEPVVRERYWITTQPGEIRACDGCHGVNDRDQAGVSPSRQVPQALTRLLATVRLP